jgi:hypothetical protein
MSGNVIFGTVSDSCTLRLRSNQPIEKNYSFSEQIADKVGNPTVFSVLGNCRFS